MASLGPVANLSRIGPPSSKDWLFWFKDAQGWSGESRESGPSSKLRLPVQ